LILNIQLLEEVEFMGWFEFGTEIIAIEDSDHVGWTESLTTFGDVTFRSLEEFVDVVLKELGNRKLALLHILVHGSPYEVNFGPDLLSISSFDTFKATLMRLTPKFTHDAWVDFRACNIGQNLAFMRKFRELWGVGVVAGRGRQCNVLDSNLGLYQVVYRDGSETLWFTAPPWVAFSLTRRTTLSVLSSL
jgi:hypothetical protein